MAGKIFINYRRGDDPGYTQALYQRLEHEFRDGALFMDVEGQIKPGDDFVEVLNAQVAAADVLLVVIGPRWAELFSQRQNDPDDFVAIEIKAALDQGKRVIPVLVGGAGIPRAETLPEPIRPLARRNAVGLRPERFKADCQGLVTALKESLAVAEQERAARTEAERKAAEAARRQAEAQAAARAQAAEERGRAQAAAGPSADEIRKAEELASWDFVKDRNDLQDMRDHLARFPGGTTERYALTKLDGLVWAGLGTKPTTAQLRAYLDEFPRGAKAAAGQARIAAMEQEAAAAASTAERAREETEAWGAIAAGADQAAIEAFLKDWPNGQHAVAAKARLQELSLGKGTLRRGVMLGAGATAVIAVVVLAGWYDYQRARLLPIFWYVRASALTAEAERALKPGGAFKECASCPEMVVMPAGSFTLGSPSNEEGRGSDEGPQRQVRIRQPFAVGKFEVTFDEWDACVAHGGCKPQPDDLSWGRGRRPVIHVSWDDAKQYVAWIAKLTGKPYRLLTEVEWEYAARAGGSGRYSFGDDERQLGDHAWYGRNSGGKTQPVGQKIANAFGLHDMHGNVREWVEDCYRDSYQGAPTDGLAWTTGDCGRRVVRGGSWLSYPRDLRSAYRLWFTTDSRIYVQGFRLARTLSP